MIGDPGEAGIPTPVAAGIGEVVEAGGTALVGLSDELRVVLMEPPAVSGLNDGRFVAKFAGSTRNVFVEDEAIAEDIDMLSPIPDGTITPFSEEEEEELNVALLGIAGTDDAG